MFENLLFEKKDDIAFITVNRPSVRNALNDETMRELRTAFEQAKEDNEVRVAILTGAGDKAFVAGADINVLAKQTPITGAQHAASGQNLLSFIENLGKPVIAALNGYTLGGGCELAMACTLRIASETAMLGQPEVKLGIIAGNGGTQRLPRLVGKGRALQLLLTGELIPAQEAFRIGLVNLVVPQAQLMDAAVALAKKIIPNAPLAIRYTLEAVNRGLEMTQEEGLALEASLAGLSFASEDMKEGVRAFLEKRPANFKGR
ncbi:MAG TPA: enoyl-CoA hydratase-related protein [Terriglobia bacterium]|nr:enoyl-CoA hydratase-related protein [Terriglobia bacterium]